MLNSSLHHRHSTLLRSACGPSRTVTPTLTGDLLTPRQQQARRRRLVVQNTEQTGNVVTLNTWKDKGCDLMKSGITAELRDEIITYGELVQAAYDNLGQDKGKPEQYGNAMKAPEQLLSYLQGNYRLAVPPTANGNGNGVKSAKSTYDRYKLPAVREDGLSPLFEGLPGTAAGKNAEARPWSKLTGLNGLLSVRMALWDKICTTVPALAVQFIGGASPLFDKGELGRGTKPRGTFFGYVALSEPNESADKASSKSAAMSNGNSTSAGQQKQSAAVSNGNGTSAGQQKNTEAGRDVALVWRGTIFKEEWESNFCEDQLDFWSTDQWDVKIVPRAHEVGVHAGFCDLYTRPVHNPNIHQGKPVGKDAPPPREVVHAWLMQLMKDYNIATITSTGHSLGGGLATVCAYDVALWLEENWPKWKDVQQKEGCQWETQEAPKVRMVTFAAPRAGNAEFVERFHSLGIKALRVENEGDKVPDVPGIFVQGITVIVETIDRLRGGAARVDMTSNTVTWWRKRYQDVCSWPFLDNFYRRDPTDPNLKGRTASDDTQGCSDKYEGVPWLQPLLGLHVWGFFHVGQVLKLDAAWAKVGPKRWQPLSAPSKPLPPFLKKLGVGQVHNLELYLYLISLLNQDGPPQGRTAGAAATRNPLLLNKSDDILGEEKLPATWWGEDDKRGCIPIDGRWVYVPQAAPQPAAAAAAAAAAPEPAAAPQPAAAVTPTQSG